MPRIVDDLLYKDEVYAIIGAAIEVHKELGPGFLEPVYQECLEIELSSREIEFESQRPLYIYYKTCSSRKSTSRILFVWERSSSR